MRKKEEPEDEPAVPEAKGKEDTDAGVVTSDKGVADDAGAKTKVFGTEEKQTIQEKVTQIDLKKPMHGPSKEFSPY